jgi:hypothetical protein
LGLQEEAPAAPQVMASDMAAPACGCEVACGCNSCCNCYLFGDGEAWELMSGDNCHGLKIGGWMQAGYHSHATPLSSVYGEGLSFNDVPHQVNLHQAWLYAEKALDDTDCAWDWGYRVDFLYGTDAQKTQAFGGPGWDNDWDHGVYGFALPQAYLEFGRGDLSVKVGHFYTLIGYEVVPAPDNFFYSHSLTMFNSEPFTHTGFVATYGLTDDIELYGGWTAGWDTGFEQFNDGSSFLGGMSLTLTDEASLTYIVTAGNLGWRGDDAYTHSVVLNVAVTDKLTYVLQNDIVDVDSTGEYDKGFNQYLLYAVSDCVGLGARLEWWEDDGDEYTEVTFGANLRPSANLVFRPEIRFDGGDSNAENETTFGVDAILTF